MARILHVTTCYAGGVSRAIETAVRLAPSHEHHILWAGTEEPPQDLYDSVTAFPSMVLRYLSVLNEAIVRISPEIIHAHSSWAGVVARLASRGRSKLAYEPHCYKFDDPDVNDVLRVTYRGVEKLLARRADVTVVLSDHERRLAKSLSTRMPTHYIPNAPFLREPADVQGHSEKREVTMIGRIAPQKDPGFFAAVCEAVKSTDPTISFKWIGDGDIPQKRLLLQTGVEVTGWLDRESLASQLRETGLYLHSAKYEGFPLSILDAAAMGVPIIARDIAAIEGTPLWRVGSVEEASKAVRLILNDKSHRTRARQSGEDLLVVMNEESQAEALQDLYANLADTDQEKVHVGR